MQAQLELDLLRELQSAGASDERLRHASQVFHQGENFTVWDSLGIQELDWWSEFVTARASCPESTKFEVLGCYRYTSQAANQYMQEKVMERLRERLETVAPDDREAFLIGAMQSGPVQAQGALFLRNALLELLPAVSVAARSARAASIASRASRIERTAAAGGIAAEEAAAAGRAANR
ncbi:MAG: hypothetical protein K1X75_12535 [Leptospirales bacterium]|nr:hypothetical protein [Leptospirales bacterium]